MMLKRLDRAATRSLILAVALAASADAAQAQVVNGKWRLPPSGGSGRSAEIPKAPPAPAVDPFRNPSFPSQPAHPVSFTLVPAILMSDGSIFANFGFGFEPVVRPCSGFVDVGQPSRRVGANGVVLHSNRIPYTPPVPNQTTASQQMTHQTNALSRVAQSACFSRDNAGRVFVFRPV